MELTALGHGDEGPSQLSRKEQRKGEIGTNATKTATERQCVSETTERETQGRMELTASTAQAVTEQKLRFLGFCWEPQPRS